jgi:predicted acylesterase/phospholipase RssA
VTERRDVAVVLSGGGMKGILLELGFLQRLRASELSARVGRIFGTSAGALSGAMTALGRLDDLEQPAGFRIS